MTQDARWSEVARAAARAFDLVPATSDGAPSDPAAGEPREGDAADRAAGRIGARLDTDPENVERDLFKLVLTLVELLRQLMERTALHRVDQGDLSEDQEERIGLTLMLLEERMSELCDRHGLSMDELNLDLGPLGSLLPRDSR